MHKLAVHDRVTFTNPLDGAAKPGVIVAVVPDTRFGADGTPIEVDVYEVALDDGSFVRCERADLRAQGVNAT